MLIRLPSVYETSHSSSASGYRTALSTLSPTRPLPLHHDLLPSHPTLSPSLPSQITQHRTIRLAVRHPASARYWIVSREFRMVWRKEEEIEGQRERIIRRPNCQSHRRSFALPLVSIDYGGGRRTTSKEAGTTSKGETRQITSSSTRSLQRLFLHLVSRRLRQLRLDTRGEITSRRKRNRFDDSIGETLERREKLAEEIDGRGFDHAIAVERCIDLRHRLRRTLSSWNFCWMVSRLSFQPKISLTSGLRRCNLYNSSMALSVFVALSFIASFVFDCLDLRRTKFAPRVRGAV